jgi:FKBP-type peptidyl-prolyl cis-trans isomerase
MTRHLFAALGAFALFGLLGCDGEEKAETKAPAVPKLSDLKKTDVKVGEGPVAEKGDLVTMMYTGRLVNGTVFDSNDKPGGLPFVFRLGEPVVIQGWNEGIPGMRVGGTRKLEIPAEKAYGGQAAGAIPANSDLIFEVELLDVVKKGEEEIYDKEDLKVGSGAAAEEGDTVTVHYKATLANGRRFDSTYEREKPETFQLGAGLVIPGLEAGIKGMKVGGKRKLRLPPEVGYGPYGMGVIPGNSVTFFEVELLKVKKG